MNSLRDPSIEQTLETLHRRAAQDRVVFARALPGVIGGMLRGKGFMEAAKPYLKDAYIPIDQEQGHVLYQIARARGARRIVEFGASFGISAIYLAAAVRDNGGVPPYAETRGYVPKVLAAFAVARGLCVTPPELVSDPCVFYVGTM